MKEFEFTKGEWINDRTMIKCNRITIGFTSILTPRVDQTRLDGESWIDMRDRIKQDLIEEKANAKLIAAAPDLLYAIIDLVEIVDTLPEDKSLITALDNARKAIDKATKQKL